MGVLDDFMVNPNISLLDKTRYPGPGAGAGHARDARRNRPREGRCTRAEARCANGRSSCSPGSVKASKAARDANSPR